jgi:hypothetical protein
MPALGAAGGEMPSLTAVQAMLTVPGPLEITRDEA